MMYVLSSVMIPGIQNILQMISFVRKEKNNMKLLNALLITMKIVMKIVIKEHITLDDMYAFNDAITDVESQIKRLEDAANDED